jgi:ubiquinone/menaquinone biosynthesis C-methylase UbiE
MLNDSGTQQSAEGVSPGTVKSSRLSAGNRWRSPKQRLEDERVSEAEARMRGHDAYDLIEDEFNQDLDRSLGPTGPDGLFGRVADMALPSGAVVVDVGCGEGEHAVELATRFGFQVIGVDPVRRCVDAARLLAPPGCPVNFAIGTSELLPLPSGSADLIWCRDVLSLVEDQDGAYSEFRRVLKPGGRAVIYQTFATRMLEPGEAAFLLPAMGCSASAMRPETTEAAINQAGLRIERRVVLGSDWGEYYQEHVPERCGHLLHAARLLREPERYITRFGKQNYDIKLGDCLWHVYRMIGKLSSRVYLLSAPNEVGMPGTTAGSAEPGG